MLFRRNQASKALNDAANSEAAVKFEEEGWEVVKPTVGGNSESREKTRLTPAITDDVCVKASISEAEVSKDESLKILHSGQENSFVPFVGPTTGEEKELGNSFDVIPSMPAWLASMDYDQLVDHGTKGYYLVKRNLKTVAVLFLLGVFCVNSIPRSKREGVPPCPMQDDKQQENEYDGMIEKLRSQIEQLEETNRQVSHELSTVAFERNHWRTAALSCDHDLREMSSAHLKLEEEINQSKWLAPVAFVSSPAPPRPNITAIGDAPYLEYDLRAPEPAPPRRIPYPQLALPEPEPEPGTIPPKPSMKMGRAKKYSGVVLAPSVAVTAV